MNQLCVEIKIIIPQITVPWKVSGLPSVKPPPAARVTQPAGDIVVPLSRMFTFVQCIVSVLPSWKLSAVGILGLSK